MLAGRTRVATAGALALLALAACSRETKIGPTTYVTAHPSTPPSSSTPPPSSSPDASTGSASPVAAMRHLPGGCADRLPIGSVIDAVGGKVGARTAFVQGLPDPAIGRVGYLNCRYGLSKQQSAPAIEIGVSLYKTDAKAAARLQPTIDEFTQHGAHATQTTVHGMPATVLTGAAGAGYGPTIAMALGQRTIAVTLRPGAFAPATVGKHLTDLAALAAHETSAQ